MIQRKDGRFQDQTTVDGKRKYFYGKSPQEVKRKMAAYNKTQEKGKLFRDVADEWESKHRERVTFNAWNVYVAPLRRVKELYTGSIKDIRPGQIQALINELAKHEYARRTVQLYLDMLRMIYDYAVVEGYVDTNPCLSVHIPSGLKADTRELPSDADIEIVKNSADKTFGLFAYFILYSGLRRGELLALRYEDIDFTNNTIQISKSIYYESNQPKGKAPKTKAGNRTIILLDILSQKLDKGGKGYIFGGAKPLSKTEFRRRWKNYCIESGLADATIEKRKNKRGKEYEHKDYAPRITPHQLRHYYATFLYEAGIQDKDAQILLGHSNIQTTKDIYTHIRDSRRSGVAEALNKYVSDS